MRPIRYPLEALAVALRIELRVIEHGDGVELLGLAAIADRLGIDHRQARRCLRFGLNDRQADRFAVRIGRHPASIWPEWWEAIGETIPGTCRCRRQRHLIGYICDRCGRPQADAQWVADDPPLESLRPRRRLVRAVAP